MAEYATQNSPRNLELRLWGAIYDKIIIYSHMFSSSWHHIDRKIKKQVKARKKKELQIKFVVRMKTFSDNEL